MKKTMLVLSVIFAATHFLLAQCPTDISFWSQAQVDNFPINYPGCKDISGNVTIGNGWITNLNGITGLHSIGGNLSIQGNPALVSLAGLDSLVSINGYLEIADNYLLTDLHGLDSLRWVQQRFVPLHSSVYKIGYQYFPSISQ